MYVSKVFNTQLVLILSWQIGQNVFKNVFGTELSDFHELTFTDLKAYFQKQKPKVIKFRNHKKFDNNLFINDFLNELLSKNVQTKHLDLFKSIVQYTLDRHAPLKEKHVR